MPRKILKTFKNHREKMSVHVNVCTSKIMCMSIKVGIYIYMAHTNCLTLLSSCRELSHLSAGNRSTSAPMFFRRYCKDMQNSYFGHFGQA